ncbi:MAG: Gfo/Idh/MocA family oxidoreductase [Deltaproteobacteria bacterium]|nr:Gfo/Idh/MocA family oxidoreductase [Deltaproteobacteria bacterium]
MKIGAIIQARMGSERFPGKVLHPVAGRPLLGYLLRRLERCRSLESLTLATSSSPQDDPLAEFASKAGLACVRGSLEDVAGRFVTALKTLDLDGFVRVCADSPWLDPQLVDQGVGLFSGGDWDLATNLHPRTFPPGQSVEVLRTETFLRTYPLMIEAADKEHVTRFFYRHPDGFKICNFEAGRDFDGLSLAVDTAGQMAAFEAVAAGLERPQWDYGWQETARLYQKLGQVGVVGLGVGEQHARKVAADGRLRLRWLLDHDQAKARALAAELGAEGTAASFEELLADPDLEAVILASFDHHHFAQVVAALQAGKHVFVEKPLCRSLEELKTVKAAWFKHRGRLKLGSNLILRAAPLYVWLKEELASGRLGRPFSFDGEYLYGRLHKITHGWRKDVEDYSVMEGGGVHLVDLLLWLTGQRPSQVWAAGNRICTEGTDFGYNDFVAATMRFPSGLIARITANFGCVHPHQHVLRLFGTEATFIYDDAGARLHCSRDPRSPVRPVAENPRPAHKGDLLPGFFSAVIEDQDLTAETQTLFDVISVCEACDQAQKTNSLVKVSYV